MATLPQWTKTLDDDFVNTWYEIRAEVEDNVLNATILSAALKNFGCFTEQVGSNIVTRTIGYGEKSTQRFVRGTTMTQEVKDLDTMAEWNWRYFAVDVNRNLVDDSQNTGKFQIKSYVARRLEAARNALVQDIETYLFQWGAYYSAPYQMKGIYDICPLATAESAVGAGAASDYNDQSAGVSNGKIDRVNAWWRNWIMADGETASLANFNGGPTNEPYALNLVPDMRHMFNLIRANQEAPNLILCDQDIYEAYEDEAQDKQQIVQSAFTKKAVDLGFDAFTYKGATMSYSGKLASSKHIFMLNMNHVEIVYNPNVWFDMGEWKTTPLQFERVAFIVCMTTGLITDQPRRHGSMEYAS